MLTSNDIPTSTHAHHVQEHFLHFTRQLSRNQTTVLLVKKVVVLHKGLQLRHFKRRYADSAIIDNSFTCIKAVVLHKGLQLRHFK